MGGGLGLVCCYGFIVLYSASGQNAGMVLRAVLRLAMGMVESGTAFAVCGNHEHKLVRALRGRKVVAVPLGSEVLIDADGEAPGRLPATFTLIPGGLNFRS